MQVEGMAGKRTDWKMYLVQELCNTSLALALASGVLHAKGLLGEKVPVLVRL